MKITISRDGDDLEWEIDPPNAPKSEILGVLNAVTAMVEEDYRCRIGQSKTNLTPDAPPISKE